MNARWPRGPGCCYRRTQPHHRTDLLLSGPPANRRERYHDSGTAATRSGSAISYPRPAAARVPARLPSRAIAPHPAAHGTQVGVHARQSEHHRGAVAKRGPPESVGGIVRQEAVRDCHRHCGQPRHGQLPQHEVAESAHHGEYHRVHQVVAQRVRPEGVVEESLIGHLDRSGRGRSAKSCSTERPGAERSPCVVRIPGTPNHPTQNPDVRRTARSTRR